MTPEQRDAAAGRIRRWREDRGILQFVSEELQVDPDAWQRDALLAMANPLPEFQRVSLQACAGPGKSAVLAWFGWWFLACQGEAGEHPKGLATSITGDNLKANLWAEYAKWQPRSAYLTRGFTWTSSAIFANGHPATWRLEARSWPKTANAEEQGKTLSGLHSKYVMAQVDESGAVPTTVARAAEQALSNTVFGKLIQAGNPISLDGMLYMAAGPQRHLWVVIRITGDPDDPKRSKRIDLAWARQQLELHGRENPWVKSYILGQFPPASINALLGIEEVEAAMKRHLPEDVYEWSDKRLGVDVARFGDDRTVIFPRQGAAAFQPIVMRGERTTAIAARVARAFTQWNADEVFVDDTGHWGHGVIDNLVTAGYPAVGVTVSDPAINRRYRNRRAEQWLEMADWVKKGGALPPIAELVAELITPTYTFVNGKFLLEDKDQVKLRLGRSPDLADGLSLTFSMPDRPNKVMERMRGAQKVRHEFDPYDDTQRDEGYGRARMMDNPFEEPR